MLKIKDNVDLKELEKFGFKYSEEERNYYKCVFLDKSDVVMEYWIDIDTRVIEFDVDSITISDCDSTIYDLTKDGIVEKVSD